MLDLASSELPYTITMSVLSERALTTFVRTSVLAIDDKLVLPKLLAESVLSEQLQRGGLSARCSRSMVGARMKQSAAWIIGFDRFDHAKNSAYWLLFWRNVVTPDSLYGFSS